MTFIEKLTSLQAVFIDTPLLFITLKRILNLAR